MFRTISMNLRPGGRMVALVPNLKIDLSEGSLDDRYGVTLEGVEKIEGGWRIKATTYTEPERFEIYACLLNEEGLYERCAERAGLKGFRWRDITLPDDGREDGYWDVYVEKSFIAACEAWRSVVDAGFGVERRPLDPERLTAFYC